VSQTTKTQIVTAKLVKTESVAQQVLAVNKAVEVLAETVEAEPLTAAVAEAVLQAEAADIFQPAEEMVDRDSYRVLQPAEAEATEAEAEWAQLTVLVVAEATLAEEREAQVAVLLDLPEVVEVLRIMELTNLTLEQTTAALALLR
jgi:hypothetical protein